MRDVILIGILIFCGFSAQSQDSLLRYSKETHKVYQGNTKMSMDDLFRTMRPHPEPFELIQSARDHKFFSRIFYNLSGIPLGFSLGYLLATNEVIKPVLFAGIGLFAVGIPFNIMYLKRMQKAVVSYNGRKEATSYRSHLEFSVGLNANGFGLQITL